jgi:hypothetical protein
MPALSILNDWQDHIGSICFVFLTGAQFASFLGHLVNQIETPKSEIGRLLLWSTKYWVGQRLSAMNALNGMQTATVAVTTEQKALLANGSSLKITPTDSESLPK